MYGRLFASILLIVGIVHTADVHADDDSKLPERSIYQLDSNWEDESGKSLKLRSLQGRKQVVFMGYTRCPRTCPVTVHFLQGVDSALQSDEKEKVNFLFVTLDPEHDTPPVLREFMGRKSLPSARWKFLRGSEEDTRELAVLLGLRYREEGEEISHSNALNVLDERGELLLQLKNPSGEGPTLLETLRKR